MRAEFLGEDLTEYLDNGFDINSITMWDEDPAICIEIYAEGIRDVRVVMLYSNQLAVFFNKCFSKRLVLFTPQTKRERDLFKSCRIFIDSDLRFGCELIIKPKDMTYMSKPKCLYDRKKSKRNNDSSNKRLRLA